MRPVREGARGRTVDIRWQMEARRRRLELELPEQRSRTRRLSALGSLVISITMAVLVLFGND